MENFRKDSAKHKKDKEDEKLRKWSAKKKQMYPNDKFSTKWQKFFLYKQLKSKY